MDDGHDQGNADDPLPALPTVNFHFWAPCNMRCGFCFAPFNDLKVTLPKGHLQREEALSLVRKLAAHGFKKITFVGGEPTLAPWLPELLATARETGMVSSMVTNGKKLSSDWLNDFGHLLDWIALSIDSLDHATNVRSGRTVNGKPIREETYFDLCKEIQSHGIRLKINTVVHAFNWQEMMHPFIDKVGPFRWKIMQVLPVVGENHESFQKFAISQHQFNAFVGKNRPSNGGIAIVPEDNEVMRGSYVMVNPAGCFFDNSTGGYTTSEPILNIGVENALGQVNIDSRKFNQRDGAYDFLPTITYK